MNKLDIPDEYLPPEEDWMADAVATYGNGCTVRDLRLDRFLSRLGYRQKAENLTREGSWEHFQAMDFYSEFLRILGIDDPQKAAYLRVLHEWSYGMGKHAESIEWAERLLDGPEEVLKQRQRRNEPA